jgi:predicted RNA binding protein YcfA (HicA-like mRNA interferase family)
MARKIRELIAELERAGFATRSGKGSHRIFIHKNCPMNLPAASCGVSQGW